MHEVLKVENLEKTFSSRKFNKKLKLEKKLTKAVKGISFSLEKGEILGLLGPNGAGKTTTIQMLLGSLSPTSGKISYFGEPFSGQPEIMKRINFSSTYIRLPWTMTVWENLNIYGRLYGIKDRKERIKKLLKQFEIAEFVHKKFSLLSEGQKTRVILAKAFLNYPEVILLDEPTASLDPEIASKIRKFLLAQQKEFGVSMLFTSHNMKEVQEVCDRIIFLDKGKIIAEDTPQGLIGKNHQIKIKMMILDRQDLVQNYLKENKFKSQFDEISKDLEIDLDENEIAKVLFRLSEKGVRYQNLEIKRPDLEDFFLEIAKK